MSPVRWTSRAETIFATAFALACCFVGYVILLLLFARAS